MNPDEKSRENPPWTMFFEGPLYQKYDEYMKNHDFSKILQNKRLQLSSEKSNAPEKPQSKNLDPWENPEYDNVAPISTQFKSPSLDSYEYQEDKRRRRRRTCCFVCSGMLVIALLSLATALIIHYVFIIEPKDAEYKTQVNVSVDGNDVEPKINSSLLNLNRGDSRSTTDDTLTTKSKGTSSVTTAAAKDISMVEIDNLLGGLNSNLKADFMDELLKLTPKRLHLENAKFRTTTNNSFPKSFAFLRPPSTSTEKVAVASTVQTPTAQGKSTSSSSSASSSKSSASVTRSTSSTSEGKTSFYKSSSSNNKTTTKHLTTPFTTQVVIYKSSSPKIKMTTRHFTTPFTTKGVKSTSSTANGSFSSVSNLTFYTKASTESTISTTIPSTTLSSTSTVSSSTEQFSPSSSFNLSAFAESTFTVAESSTSLTNTSITSVTSTTIASTIDNVSFINHSETVPTTTLSTTSITSPATESTTENSFVINRTETVPTTILSTTAITSPVTTNDALSIITSSEIIPTTTLSEVSNMPTTNDSNYVSDFYTKYAVDSSTRSSNISRHSSSAVSASTDIITSSVTVDSTLEISTFPSVSQTSEEITSVSTEISNFQTSTETTSTPTEISSSTSFLSTFVPSITEATSKITHTTTSSRSTTPFSILEASTATSSSPTSLEVTTPVIQTPAKTTLAKRSLASLTTSVSPDTTTTTETPTTLPPIYNVVDMEDVTAYTLEETRIHCDVKVAIKWNSLAIRKQKGFRPLEVKLFPNGEVKWKSKFTRHRAEYLIEDGYGDVGNNVTLDLIIGNVQCRDGDIFTCILISDVIDQQAMNRLTTVGKPGKNIRLSLGPSIIEDRAVRLTVTWNGGYPIPWTNVSWSAVDRNNNSYDLTQYGEYKEFVLQVDKSFCQTRMQQDFVIFPKMHLNGTTIIVSPDLTKKKPFVNEEMTKDLVNVKPGIQSILVIPLDYCPNNKEEAIPHPYEDCRKFVWCLPGDLVVQQCPYGTCFFEKYSECLAI